MPPPLLSGFLFNIPLPRCLPPSFASIFNFELSSRTNANIITGRHPRRWGIGAYQGAIILLPEGSFYQERDPMISNVLFLPSLMLLWWQPWKWTRELGRCLRKISQISIETRFLFVTPIVKYVYYIYLLHVTRMKFVSISFERTKSWQRVIFLYSFF